MRSGVTLIETDRQALWKISPNDMQRTRVAKRKVDLAGIRKFERGLNRYAGGASWSAVLLKISELHLDPEKLIHVKSLPRTPI